MSRKERRKHLCLFEKKNPNHPIPHKVLRRKLCRENFITHKMSSNTTHNNIENNINTNNNNNNTRTNGTQACAACKYQRRKCASDCLLAPYFPHHLHHQFLNAHKLFGVSNITKIIRPLPQPQKDQAMITIMYESDARAADPVGGTCRIIRNLQRQLEFACAELDLVLQQLAICRAAAGGDTISFIADPQTQLQVNVEDVSEEVAIQCDNMININTDHEGSVYKVVDEATSPLCQQTQPHSQAEDDNNVMIQCDSMINNNPEDQLYLQDIQHLDENNEEEDGEIGEYFLEESDVNNDDNNNNVILSLQDMEAWGMQDTLAYCLHDKEGFVNECYDLKPNVVAMDGERLGHKFYMDEPQTFEHSDETVSKDIVVHEESASCISKDEKLIVKEDFVPNEDAQSHDLRSSATLSTTA